MSVIVIGMEMPESCLRCDLFAGNGCKATRTIFSDWMNVAARPKGCPLRPLPEKHGRLIDLDALLDRINGEERPEMYDGMDEVFWIQKCLEEATTIVEAEGE